MATNFSDPAARTQRSRDIYPRSSLSSLACAGLARRAGPARKARAPFELTGPEGMPRLGPTSLPPHRAAFDFARFARGFDREPALRTWSETVPSSLLPTYARADLAFDHGEGAWLTATTGERYLDFGGGIAVASLGYSHPHLVAALTAAGRQALAHLESVSNPAGRESRRAPLRGELRRLCFFHQFRRRSPRRRHQDRAQISVGERPSGEVPHHHLQGRFPRPHHRHHLGRRESEISRRVRTRARRLRHRRVRRS